MRTFVLLATQKEALKRNWTGHTHTQLLARGRLIDAFYGFVSSHTLHETCCLSPLLGRTNTRLVRTLFSRGDDTMGE